MCMHIMGALYAHTVVTPLARSARDYSLAPDDSAVGFRYQIANQKEMCGQMMFSNDVVHTC